MIELLEPKEVTFTTQLRKGAGWKVPDFCAKTKKEGVEPFFAWYNELLDILAFVRPNREEDGEYWGDWEPSKSFTRTSRLCHDIGQYAYKEVDNPNYDEDKCLFWKEEHMQGWTKFEWGESRLTPSDGA